MRVAQRLFSNAIKTQPYFQGYPGTFSWLELSHFIGNVQLNGY